MDSAVDIDTFMREVEGENPGLALEAMNNFEYRDPNLDSDADSNFEDEDSGLCLDKNPDSDSKPGQKRRATDDSSDKLRRLQRRAKLERALGLKHAATHELPSFETAAPAKLTPNQKKRLKLKRRLARNREAMLAAAANGVQPDNTNPSQEPLPLTMSQVDAQRRRRRLAARHLDELPSPDCMDVCMSHTQKMKALRENRIERAALGLAADLTRTQKTRAKNHAILARKRAAVGLPSVIAQSERVHPPGTTATQKKRILQKRSLARKRAAMGLPPAPPPPEPVYPPGMTRAQKKAARKRRKRAEMGLTEDDAATPVIEGPQRTKTQKRQDSLKRMKARRREAAAAATPLPIDKDEDDPMAQSPDSESTMSLDSHSGSSKRTKTEKRRETLKRQRARQALAVATATILPMDDGDDDDDDNDDDDNDSETATETETDIPPGQKRTKGQKSQARLKRRKERQRAAKALLDELPLPVVEDPKPKRSRTRRRAEQIKRQKQRACAAKELLGELPLGVIEADIIPTPVPALTKTQKRMAQKKRARARKVEGMMGVSAATPFPVSQRTRTQKCNDNKKRVRVRKREDEAAEKAVARLMGRVTVKTETQTSTPGEMSMAPTAVKCEPAAAQDDTRTVPEMLAALSLDDLHTKMIKQEHSDTKPVTISGGISKKRNRRRNPETIRRKRRNKEWNAKLRFPQFLAESFSKLSISDLPGMILSYFAPALASAPAPAPVSELAPAQPEADSDNDMEPELGSDTTASPPQTPLTPHSDGGKGYTPWST
ncbi:hypothetical protein B0H63DRAFT_445848 [Podospora didyma]|uniref:Uncharacterized protein n=1 Tax=Podospora didyma TaxID=330526 RepID=A0AAE0NXY4_9PEZI|nr:hypothetical protein B0H63DRAFT_445848 [Podospora didyma]